MELVRIVVQAPLLGSTWVVAVGPAGSNENLADPNKYPGLGQEIANGTPLQIEAETATVYYRFSQSTGVIDPNAMNSNATGVGTGAVLQVAGVKFAGQPAVQAEVVPDPNYWLQARTATATGVLRIKAVG